MGRLRAAMAVFYLAMFAVVTPMLVLCEEGNRHAVVESPMSLCCQEGVAGPSGANRAPSTREVTANGCAGSCTDTSFLDDIDLFSPRNIAQDLQAVAMAPPVAPAACPAPAFAHRDVSSSPDLSSPHLSRSTVLLI